CVCQERTPRVSSVRAAGRPGAVCRRRALAASLAVSAKQRLVASNGCATRCALGHLSVDLPIAAPLEQRPTPLCRAVCAPCRASRIACQVRQSRLVARARRLPLITPGAWQWLCWGCGRRG